MTALAVALATAAPADGSPKRLPALAPSANDGLARALASGRLSEAEYALERATSLFRLRAVRSRFGEVERPDGHDATPLLRDLAARVSQLSGDERARAERLLARPTDSDPEPLKEFSGYSVAEEPPLCSAAVDVCVHYVASTGDASSAEFVQATLGVLENVWTQQVDVLGYRQPLPDGARGGTGALDVYLADVGRYGVFGYCASDDPNGAYAYGVFVYCVLDNDFANAAFGTAHTPEEFRNVTAAHEFFHAVQYAYDWLEDVWLMEGTAAWMEDEIYDDVDDNVRWLSRASPLLRPDMPVDYGAEGFEYGAWIFWRYLSERLGRGFVRDVWDRVDDSVTGQDSYSIQAVKRALVARGLTFGAVFRGFGTANRRARFWYEEGFERSYPTPHTTAWYAFTRWQRTTGWRGINLYHLSNRYFSFIPGASLSRTATLRVTVDLPALRTGSHATLLVHTTSGSVRIRRPALDAAGNGTLRVAFGRGVVRRVDLVLTNASTRFDCWWGTPFSCGGLALDDRRPYRFIARVTG